MHRTSFALLGLLVLSLGACGDDDDRNGRTEYESGVRDDATAATLDDDDKRKFCGSFETHVRVTLGFEELARLSCLPEAFLFGGSQQGCEQRLDECVRNAPEPVVVDATVESQRTCVESLRTCEASVAQLEGCVNVSIDGVLDALERITCARYGDDGVMREVQDAMSTASSCAMLSGTCGNAVVVF